MRIPTSNQVVVSPEVLREKKKVLSTKDITPSVVREDKPRPQHHHRRGPPSPMRLIDRRKRDRRYLQQSTTLDTRTGKDRRKPDDTPTDICIKA